MRFFTRVIVGAVAAVIIAHIEQPVVVGDISNATLNSSELNPGAAHNSEASDPSSPHGQLVNSTPLDELADARESINDDPESSNSSSNPKQLADENSNVPEHTPGEIIIIGNPFGGEDPATSEAPQGLEEYHGDEMMQADTDVLEREFDPDSLPDNSPHRINTGAPHKQQAVFIVLVNASGYLWKRGTRHQDTKMNRWNEAWPDHIQPGEQMKAHVKREKKSGNIKHTEVTYHLEGTNNPMSFTVHFSYDEHLRKATVWMQYGGELETMDNGKFSKHISQWVESPGGVSFTLAGLEGDFISNDGPIRWMQAQLPTIGHLPLREIVMPRSHHAGLWPKASQNKDIDFFPQKSFGVPANTMTQYSNLTQQLEHGGIRVLDVRPVRSQAMFKGSWKKHAMLFEGHGSVIGLTGDWAGYLGARITEMVDWINEFNDEHPGELIIFDIHSQDAFSLYPSRKPTKLWTDHYALEQLYENLLGLKHRVELPVDGDVTNMPLNQFIGDGKSAVIIRVHDHFFRTGFNGTAAEGFARASRFRQYYHWSNTIDPKKMFADQENALRWFRRQRTDPLYNTDWVVTQEGIKSFGYFMYDNDKLWIIVTALEVWDNLFQRLWKRSTDQTYPNWITVDGVHGTELKALAMAMNHCLVARRCGSLGGKVQV